MKNILLILSFLLIFSSFGTSLLYGDNKPILVICAIGAISGMYGFHVASEKE